MNPAPQGAMQVQDCVQDEELLVLKGGRELQNLDSFYKHGSHLQQAFPGEPNRSIAVSGEK